MITNIIIIFIRISWKCFSTKIQTSESDFELTLKCEWKFMNVKTQKNRWLKYPCNEKKTFTGENEPLIGQNVIAWAFGVRKNYKTFQVFFRFGQHMYLSDHLTDASIRKRMQHACGNALRFFSFVVASKKPDRCYESHDILRLLNVFKKRASKRKAKKNK